MLEELLFVGSGVSATNEQERREKGYTLVLQEPADDAAHAGSPCALSKLSANSFRPFNSTRDSSSVNFSTARFNPRQRLSIILRAMSCIPDA